MLIFCLIFRHTSVAPKILQKIPILEKLSSGVSTGVVEMFPLEYLVLSLQPLENQSYLLKIYQK